MRTIAIPAQPRLIGSATMFFVALALWQQSVTPSFGQSKNYPAPLLSSLLPCGGQAGATVEVTIEGDDLDDARQLYFSAPGFVAELVPPAMPDPKKADPKKPAPKKKESPPIVFAVRIPANAPIGICDVRVVCKSGISNPRAFVVGKSKEIAEKEPNNDVPEAQPLATETTVNGVIAAKTDVDYYRVDAKPGERFVAHCAASSIDSRATPMLEVYGESGKLLASNRFYLDRDAVVSFEAPQGGCLIRLSEFAYQGGGKEHFYRLTVTKSPWIDAVFPPAIPKDGESDLTILGVNLPNGKPSLQKLDDGKPLEEAKVSLRAGKLFGFGTFPGRLLPRAASFDAVGFRLEAGNAISNPVVLAAVSETIVTKDKASDTRKSPQSIPVPCVVCGSFDQLGGRDHFTFEAKKGETFFVEIVGDRLRSRADLSIQIRRRDTGATVGIYDDNPELPANYDRLFTYSADPAAKFVAPADGAYELVVLSQSSASWPGRHCYELAVRRPTPDYRLIAVANHETGAGLTVRRGGSFDLQIVALRQDDFEGAIELSATGLPSGVTCVPQRIGPHSNRGVLVLSADDKTPDWSGAIVVKGTAVAGDRRIEREALPATLVYPTPQPTIPAVSRMGRSLCVAVREKGPFRLRTSVTKLPLPVGGQAKVKVKVEKQLDGVKDVQVSASANPVGRDGKAPAVAKATIGIDKEGELKITIPTNAAPGIHTLAFRGAAKVELPDPLAKKKRTVQFVAAAPPIEVDVYDQVAKLIVPPKTTLKAGTDVAMTIRVARENGYRGEFDVEVAPTPSIPGVQPGKGKIAAGSDECTVILKVGKDARPNPRVEIAVRAVAKAESITLKHEAKAVAEVVDPKVSAQSPDKNLEAVVLVKESAEGWRYSAIPAGTDWRLLDFDDRNWKPAKTPIGYGEEEIEKRKGFVISETGMSLGLRRVFEVPKGVVAKAMRLQMASDDSASVYLNGKLLDADAESHEFQYWNRDVILPAAALQPGRNVIAVELRNAGGSSDAYCDMALSVLIPAKK